MAYLVLALGLLGLLRFPVLLGLLAVTSVISTFSLISIVCEIRQSLLLRKGVKTSAQGALAVGALVIIAGLALLGALTPPAMGDWDGLAYHLAIPKLYLSHGRIFYIPFSSHSNFPFTVEMLYTLGLGLSGAALAKLFHFAFGVIAVAAVYFAVRRNFGAKYASFATLMFAGLPVVAWEATVAYNDLTVACFTILSIAAILAYSDTKDSKWLILGAISVGFAAGSKMTALAYVGIFALWSALEVFSSGRDKAAAIRQMVVFGVIASAIAAPWYIKAYIQTGNPVYPFFYDTFGGRNWSPEIAKMYRDAQQAFGMGHSFGDFLRAPWDLAFHSDKFYDRPGLYVGPAFLALLPMMIIGALRDRKVLKLACLSLIFLIVWFPMSQQSRYLLPGFGLAAVCSAGALSVLPRLRIARVAAWVSVAVSLLLSILMLRGFAMDSGRAAVGLEKQSDYLSRSLDNYRAMRYLNANTSAKSKVILFGDTRGFYLDRDYQWGDTSHNALIPYNEIKDSREFVDKLRQIGITYALVNYSFFAKDGHLPDLVRSSVESGRFNEVYRDERFPVAVYEIK